MNTRSCSWPPMQVARFWRFAARLLALPFVVMSSPALAEVCDKVVGESWTSEHGPISLFYPLSRMVWPTIAALLLIVIVWKYSLRRLAAIVAVTLLVTAILFLLWTFSGAMVDDIRPLALSEGCYSVGADLISVTYLMCLGLMFAAVGKFSRGEVEKQA